MAIGRTVHWIGVVFIIVAVALLLVTCVGAPAVNDIGLLKVTLHNSSALRHSSVVFGPFGYCVLDVAPPQTDQDYCPGASVGYIPAQVMRLLDPATIWTTWRGHSLDLMTEAYILFPIALAFAFFAAAFAFCGVIGAIVAAFLCAWAWATTLIVIVVAFISMGYLKDHVNARGLHASYGVGMWTAVAAMVLLFLAMVLLFFSCCSGLRSRNRDKKRYKNEELRRREEGRGDRDYGHDHLGDKHNGEEYAPTAAGLPLGSTGRQAPMRDSMNEKNNVRDHFGMNKRSDALAPAAAAGAAGVASRDHHQRPPTRGRSFDTDSASSRQNDAGFSPGSGAGAAGAVLSRGHPMRNNMRDNQADGDSMPLPANQRPLGLRDTPAPTHFLTTHPSPTQASYNTSPPVVAPNTPGHRDNPRSEPRFVTHHHPTTTTTTSTYYDHNRGDYNTEMYTTQHNPMNHTPRSNDGTTRFGSMRQSEYSEDSYGIAR